MKKQINVLQFICPTGFYGAEMWIIALAKYLDRRTVNCHLAITHESPAQNIELYDRFKSLGLESHILKLRGRFDPSLIIKLLKLIRINHIDIVHSHGYKSDIIGLLVARIAGIKAIATPHGFENSKDRKLQLYMRLGSVVLRYFDRVVPLSEQLLDDLIRFNINPQKIQCIHNGLDLDEIDGEKKNGCSSMYSNKHEKKICYMGQLNSRKNLVDLLRTFDLLYREEENIRLILIGDGSQRKELENYARSLTSASKISFFGYRKDRLKLLQECHLFSMTSSLEGIPRAMMEAMALEIPVAAYKIAGVDKLILHETTGLLSELGHIEELKNCWKRILNGNGFSNKLTRNAREHIIANYSARSMATEYLNLYQDLISDN